jgi:hypothetical protein
MPALMWYGGMHLKETLMIFLIVTIFYHATNIVSSGKMNITVISVMIFFSFILFYFRTFLAVFTIMCVLIYFVLFFLKRKFNKGIVFISFLIFIVIVGNLITSFGFDKEVYSTLEASQEHFNLELTHSAKQRGVSYKQGSVSPLILAGAIITPFPSLLDFEERQLGIYTKFQNELIRNIMYFFAFLGILYSIRRVFRKSSLIVMFALGHIMILAMAAVSFQGRYQLPTLPFMIIFMAVGFSYTKRPLTGRWVIYLIFLFLAIFAWNYFKMSIRGLV